MAQRVGQQTGYDRGGDRSDRNFTDIEGADVGRPDGNPVDKPSIERKDEPPCIPEAATSRNEVPGGRAAKKTFVRKRPRPPDLPKRKGHKTIRIPLPKNCTSNASIKSFKPTISLQKLFAGTSPRLVVKDNELQPAAALIQQHATLPKQHPIHNWTTGVKRHKFRIYTK